MNGVEVAFAAQHRTHPLGLPGFDLGAELSEQTNEAGQIIGVIGL